MFKSSHNRTLHLIIPDLLSRKFDLILPNLSQLLSRATIKAWQQSDFYTTLFQLFNLPTQQPLPIAPITYLIDANEKESAIWLRADPAHLYADRDRVLLFDQQMGLTITQTEADQLVHELNTFYQTEDFTFFATTPYHWYCRLTKQPDLLTTPYPQVIGKDIYQYMPQGQDHQYWRQILNEIQMLFHQSYINHNRENNQLLTINSVWFWGVGQLPQAPKSTWTQVYSNDEMVQGLAKLTQTPCDVVTDSQLFSQLETGDYLLTLSIETDWQTGLKSLEKQWFEPIMTLLKQGQFQKIRLYPCDKRIFEITPVQTYQLWRRQSWQNFV